MNRFQSLTRFSCLLEFKVKRKRPSYEDSEGKVEKIILSIDAFA